MKNTSAVKSLTTTQPAFLEETLLQRGLRMLVEARVDQLLTELVHFWHIIKWDISTWPVCAKRVSAVRSLEKDAQSVGSPRH